ncbi:c-type cytochrome biogenesis protein CcsB [Corynebacterium guangdongense]|uniref:Cytochrome c-type biogenesis protein CcsB n=1 Tax=Corynebacterium guangdongense TaxID=1783348 RepID=A0ABU1ZU45_9CORY|nr:c-type cytochrome biogenesis protein CcsB [Corynebacterium guangdongense]MDR7328446.1 cytochrome c-type biogenesis protein CcsB [Corynebacterium guangdongense]WJZ17023.1 Cytochrome c biogenesis protein CcsA [Corynebacterium guangdongense]
MLPVNQTLSNYSDIAFQSAFVIYVVALFVSLFFYGKMQGIIDARRERATRPAEASVAQRVAVGDAGSTLVDDGVPASASDANDEQLSDGELAGREARADKLSGMTQALVWVGILLHATSWVLRGVATERFPLGNLYEYMLGISLGVMIAAAVALQRRSWRSLWPWVLTPMLALMFYGGTELYAESAPVVPALQSNWLPIHVSTVAIGASIGIVSGVASLLYLLRIWQAPGQEKGFFGALAKPLPTAKKLDALAYRAAIVTLPTFGVGILLGAIWAEAAWGRFWGWDPKETVSLITWILYAAYLHARATAGWKNWKAALINIVGLASMIFNLFFINLVVSGLHSYAGLN